MDAPRRFFPARPLLALGLLLAVLAGPGAAVARDIQDDILAQTAAVRELPPKGPVPLAVVDPAQLRGELLESYNSEVTIRELEISRKLLVILGLLHPDADLHGLLVDLYAENVAGYYNRLDKKMYVVSTATDFGPSEKVTLAHEFTHALQDQHFDLAKVQAQSGENGDHSAAIQALIEGDATLTMILYARNFLNPDELLQLQTGGGASTLDRAPLIVRDEVVFPYNEGALFALRLWQEGGFRAVNQAFSNPPRSTEQIIHPEKYLAGEQPIEVPLPNLAAALGTGWTQLRSDVLGELDLRIILQAFSAPAAAARGAEGWGGDRFALLENAAGQNALVISTAWDSGDEAGEFFNDFAETVTRRYGGRARRAEDIPSKIVWSTPNGALLLQKWGPRVAIIMAPDARVMTSLAAALTGSPAPAQPPGPVPAPVQVPR